MRTFAVAFVLFIGLLAVPSSQAFDCGPVPPVGEFVDCVYEKGAGAGGRLIGDVTDTVDETYYGLPYCLREPTDPHCWN